jgi:hypothetical protein
MSGTLRRSFGGRSDGSGLRIKAAIENHGTQVSAEILTSRSEAGGFSVFALIAALFVCVVSVSAQETAKKTIDCPRCGYTNDWSSKYCLSCGASLAEAKADVLRRTGKATSPGTAEQLPVQKQTATVVVGKSAQEMTETPAPSIYEGPVDPRRLFVIPMADVLGSMEINLGGGTAFGVRKTEKRPFLGHLRLGLGDVAEVELSTVGIINRLSEGDATIPTAAFKLKFLPEGRIRPAVAGALQSSLWHSENRGRIKFEKRLSTLYIVASKTMGRLSLHAGVSVNDLRIRTKDIHADTLISPPPAEAEDKDYYNRNPVGPFAGIMAEVNPKTFLMLEVEQVAEYEFDEEETELSEDDISTEWMVIAGVRFFFADWLAVDSGVMYRSDYHGIGDAQIQAGMNINLPMQRIVRSWRAKR